MKIQYTISAMDLGSENTAEDNQRYACAVENALGKEFRNAEITVKLVSNFDSNIRVTGIDDFDDEIKNRVSEIANQIWNNADY